MTGASGAGGEQQPVILDLVVAKVLLELLAGRFVDLDAALLIVFGVVLGEDPLAGGGVLVGDSPDGPAHRHDLGQVGVAGGSRLKILCSRAWYFTTDWGLRPSRVHSKT